MIYIFDVLNGSTMVAHQSELYFFVMVSLPSSFSPNRKGYNAYLKSMGINPTDTESILFAAIPFEQFKVIDRRTIDEKIAEAAAECERLHDVYFAAIADGRKSDAAFSESNWNRRSKEFISLVKEKHNI